jgi:nucleoid DNA-binding protein
MKLTNHEFTKLLSEQLSTDEDNTSTQLAKMLAEFNKAVENGEDFIISGLGKFFLQDGSVQFHPSDEFSTEINHNYEGMEPVDVDAPLVVDSNDIKPSKSKKPVKKDVIIVDEGVEGEEDPFGIDSSEPSVLDSAVKITEDIDDEIDAEPSADDNKPVYDPSKDEATDTEVGIVDRDNGLVSEIDEPDFEGAENIGDESVVGSTDEELDIIDGNIQSSEESNDKIIIDSHTTGIDVEDDSDSSTVSDFEEPLLNFNTKNSGDVEDETEDIFDFIGVKLDDNSSTLENPSEEIEIEDNFDPIDRVIGDLDTNEDVAPFEAQIEDLDDESDIQAGVTGGPRIVKLSEHQKSQSNVMGILRLVGIAALILVTVGGAWWAYQTYFDTLFGRTSNQPIVMAIGPPANSDVGQGSQNDEDAIFQPGVSIPLGSAEDDPESEIIPEEAVSTARPDPAPVSVARTPLVSPQNEPTTTQEATQSGNIYGLRGTSKDIQGDLFSIIVHSLPSEISANEECNKIVASGLRCIVRVATRPDGRTTYRVGVGQFPSMVAAQEHVDLLDEPFKSRNFVARVN